MRPRVRLKRQRKLKLRYINHIIFGGQGFIGQNLCQNLTGMNKNTVVSVDKNIWGIEYFETLKSKNNFKYLNFDINENTQFIEKKLSEYNFSSDETMVWHLAANSDIRAGNESIRIDLNNTFLTTINIIEMCKKLGLKNLSFASSSAVYGNWAGANPYNEELKTQPISNYGAMKLASEACLSAAFDEFLEELNIFRFPNVIGYPATHGIIPDLILKLQSDPTRLDVLGNGLQNKPYLHVDDLVDAMFAIVKSNKTSNAMSIHNIASSFPNVYVREIAEMVVNAISPDAEIRYGKTFGGWRGDVPEVHFDTSKLQKLGWTCRHDGQEAVRRTIESIINAGIK